jgi:hypothetical protein
MNSVLRCDSSDRGRYNDYLLAARQAVLAERQCRGSTAQLSRYGT